MAAPALNLDLSGIAVDQLEIPDPIANAFSTVQTTVNSLGNVHIAADAAIDTDKLELGSGSTTVIVLNNNVALQFKNAAGSPAGSMKQNTSNDLVIEGASAGISLQAGNGVTAFAKSGVTNKSRAYDSAIAKYIEKYHDGTDGFINVSSGILALATQSANSDIVLSPQRDVRPAANGSNKLGVASSQWHTYYGVNADVISSDRRMKSAIRDSDLGLDFVMKLRPRSYQKKGSKHREYGFVAQEVEKVVPTKNTIISHDPKSDTYGLKYTELIAPLVRAIQELQQQIVDLRTTND